MSADQVRVGEPVKPTTVAAGTDNDLTDPRHYQFRDGRGKVTYANPVIVSSRVANNPIRVTINKGDTDISATNPGITIPVGGDPVDLSFGGIVRVQDVAIATQHASDDIDSVDIIGWPVGAN